MLEIKKAVYAAASKVNITIYDYLPKVEEYPYIMITSSNSSADMLKNAEERTYFFTLDIFSSYQGEKEVIQIMEQIKTNMKDLLALGHVMTINLEQFSIINDTNPIVKHGVLIYKIITMEV